jgi:glutathione synthase/RimK-type ligase-like ATP-grasp enzyme
MGSRLPRVAFATSGAYASGSDDDRRLVAPLAARGLHAEPVVWNDPAVAWTRYAAVVLRSTWDYHLDPLPFLAWIARLEAAGVLLLNPAAVVRWNADKRYLRDLEARGIPIVPTELIAKGDARPLTTLAAARGWERVVVKPAVSASAHETWLSAAPIAPADEMRYSAQDATHGLLVQEFVSAIRTEGEWSLQFFNARFSHAVRKLPRAGDYRVQGEHGGVSKREAPEAWLVAAARAVFDALPFPAAACAYARVDGVATGGRFLLMELELVEPSLFLAQDPRAAERFAATIEDRVTARGERLRAHPPWARWPTSRP